MLKFSKKALLTILPLMLLICNVTTAQELSKKQKKMKEREENLVKLDELIKSKQFVVEVDQIVLNGGNIVKVNSSNNFFLIDKEYTSIQYTYNNPISGYSKVQGVTYYGDKSGLLSEGILDVYEIKERKKGKPIIANGVIIPSIGGNTRFSISCNSSGIASVTLRNQKSEQIVLQGQIYSLEDTRVYNRVKRNNEE